MLITKEEREIMSADTSVTETVKKIAAKILRRQEAELSMDASFKDLKADSLDVVQILVQVEDTYDIEIQDEDMQNITNMSEFVSYVEKKIAENR
jgi:acyl carrier protein